MSEKLRVICYQDHGVWLAQALEHDICVQADSLDDLYGRLEVAVRLESESGGLDNIAPAPAHFQRMWDKKAGSYTPMSANSDHYEMALAA
ncbi:hypothetical protein [Nitratireductor pacificus]|uniref:DUF1902 domain-containing protein n=1 Tax=Nitratireductor pacificus pht-3B TaxID=391937 RepID=K2LQV4_9HYPH|nr:hypothetical protein [Nitratireductor pacificus]EKF20109.1 hypothetical protein NA2_04946 [Nitratireductor pacificus pht-3B]